MNDTTDEGRTMTTMTSYPHGVPCWMDLATPDPAGARSFYGELFGWEFTEESTDRPDVAYSMARKDGHTAAGMMLLSEEMSSGGMPPAWTTYVNVDDVEATVSKVQPAGGAVLQPPLEVMDAGRMATVADPAGAVLALWEPAGHIGAEVVNEHGALIWNELTTPDPAAVSGFYGSVFGWTSESVPMEGGGEYILFHLESAEQPVAGATPPPAPAVRTSWGVYFAVDDAAMIVARAKELGGEIFLGPTTMPGVGTMATLRDPHGAMFSVMTPEG